MKQKQKRIISLFVSFVMLLGCTFGITPSVFAESNGQENSDNIKDILTGNINLTEEEIKEIKEGINVQPVEKAFSDLNENAPSKQIEYKPDDVVRIIVELEDLSIADMSQEQDIREAANDETLINKVYMTQESAINSIKEINNDVEIKERFNVLINGFSLDAKYKDIERIRNLTNVKRVSLVNYYVPMMNNARTMTGHIEKISKDLGLTGEGMVVAILDTGIDYLHKDMRLSNSDNITLTRQKIEELRAGDSRLVKGRWITEKVPFGYNYADEDQVVLHAQGTSNHGSHVAGIVGANCTDEDFAADTGIRGVAPEVQMLAMKVFPNKPESKAGADKIVAAIEDSVKLGADVINMSLGADAGFQACPEDTELVAIKKASENGVISVISAGNSTYSTYPTFRRDFKDTATVGSPGTAPEALTVASYENSRYKSIVFRYIFDGNIKYAPYTPGKAVVETEALNNDNGYEVAYCGYGQEEGFKGVDVKGKIALIKRGKCGFVDKQINAQKNGAVGVIVFNDEERGDALTGMNEHDDLKIPAVFTGNTYGTEILNNIASVRITFKGDEKQVNNFNAGEMSYYSSWGPTPNLDIKPEITGVGGDVYSTVEEGKYGIKSGTSMSSPYIAGFTALYLQQLKKDGVKIEGIDKINFVKQILINSADPVVDEVSGLPSSPRRQGAGLVNMDKALENKVTATFDGEAVAALRQIGKETNFNITVTNYSATTPAAFTLNTLDGVLTEQNEADFSASENKMAYEMKLPGAEITFDKTSFVVTTGAPITIKATLKLSDETPVNSFAEGFIKFKSTTEGVPDIGMPFMGFYGEWSDFQIIDKPRYEKDSFYKLASMLIAKKDGGLLYAGMDENKIIHPEAFAINPSDEDGKSGILPSLSLLRNAKYLKIEVVDKDNNVVHEIVNDTYWRKEVVQDDRQDFKIYDFMKWDGLLHNDKGDVIGIPKDGQYDVRISAKYDDKGDWQELRMPIKIDTTEPVVETENYVVNSGSNKINLQFTAKDLSPIESMAFLVYDLKDTTKKTIIPAVDVLSQFNPNTNKYTVEVDMPFVSNIVVPIPIDAAGNLGFNNKPIIVNKDGNVDGIKINEPSAGKIFAAGEEVKLSYEANTEDKELKYEITIMNTSSENSYYDVIDNENKNEYTIKNLKPGLYYVIIKEIKNNNVTKVGATAISVYNGDAPIKVTNLTEKIRFANGEQAEIKINVKNLSSSNINAVLIVGLFNEKGEMVQVMGNKQVINNGTDVELNAFINLPESGKYTLKAFVWDDLKAGKPLSNVIQYEVTSAK